MFLNFLVVQTMLSALLQALVADLKDNLRYAVRKLKPQLAGKRNDSQKRSFGDLSLRGSCVCRFHIESTFGLIFCTFHLWHLPLGAPIAWFRPESPSPRCGNGRFIPPFFPTNPLTLAGHRVRCWTFVKTIFCFDTYGNPVFTDCALFRLFQLTGIRLSSAVRFPVVFFYTGIRLNKLCAYPYLTLIFGILPSEVFHWFFWWASALSNLLWRGRTPRKGRFCAFKGFFYAYGGVNYA